MPLWLLALHALANALGALLGALAGYKLGERVRRSKSR